MADLGPNVTELLKAVVVALIAFFTGRKYGKRKRDGQP